MTIKEMKDRKIELGLTNDMIAEASGIPLSTIQKIFSGATKAPRKLTLDAITKVLVPDTGKEDRLYTLEDYYALPDDVRAELIDGKLFYMTAPSGIHQLILGELHVQFYNCMRDHANNCRVYLSPYDVRLNKDNYTMVEPDLVIICREYDHINNIRYEGAPDMTVEILSQSTRSKDMLLKLNKYYEAGVREYWIVDPKNKIVIVHFFEDENYAPKIYTFDDKVPVGISKGFCEIDFAEIKKNIYNN